MDNNRYNFENPAASASDALAQFLVQQQAQKRQAMLDALNAQAQQASIANAAENTASLRDQRMATEEDNRQKLAAGVAGVLTPGQDISGDTASTLSAGHLGDLVQGPPMVQGIPQMSLSDVAANRAPSTRYTGTPAQLQAQDLRQVRATQLADPNTPQGLRTWLAVAPPGSTPPAELVAPKTPHSASYTEWQDYKNSGGTLDYNAYQTMDANRKRPTTATNTSGGISTTPADIRSDVEDVLTGKNTLYNIRMSMGRSNQTGAYMQNMRAAVKKEDPSFDFVASDAGGKSVSTPYVQRTTAAINGVLPNLQKITDLSSQVDRIGVTGIDALLQRGAMQFGDQKVTSLHQARKLLADEIGAALGSGSASDMKLQLGFDVTDPSVSDENFANNIGLVRDFLTNRKKGLDSLRYKSGTTTPSTPAAPSTPSKYKVTVE